MPEMSLGAWLIGIGVLNVSDVDALVALEASVAFVPCGPELAS